MCVCGQGGDGRYTGGGECGVVPMHGTISPMHAEEVAHQELYYGGLSECLIAFTFQKPLIHVQLLCDETPHLSLQ